MKRKNMAKGVSNVSKGTVLFDTLKSVSKRTVPFDTFDTFMDLLFPPSLYCHCCGNLIDQTRTYGLCDHCIRHIRWDRGAPLVRDGMVMVRCAEYGIYERSLIFALKYNGHRYIARSIAEMMADRLALTSLEFDVIVPIPMHKTKQRKRGFNHAALIGKYLADRTGTVCLPEALVRTQDTRPMRGLSPTERENNIRGHISLGPQARELVGKRVLLLDDFFTTGATARECRRALDQAEPSDVMLLAFAAKY